LNIDDRFIVGKVGEPNEYSVEHNLSSDLIYMSYFILENCGQMRAEGLNKNDFEEKCKELNIHDCSLKRAGILSFIYDPSYWFTIYSDGKDFSSSHSLR
jgi:hypothetical protein